MLELFLDKEYKQKSDNSTFLKYIIPLEFRISWVKDSESTAMFYYLRYSGAADLLFSLRFDWININWEKFTDDFKSNPWKALYLRMNFKSINWERFIFFLFYRTSFIYKNFYLYTGRSFSEFVYFNFLNSRLYLSLRWRENIYRAISLCYFLYLKSVPEIFNLYSLGFFYNKVQHSGSIGCFLSNKYSAGIKATFDIFFYKYIDAYHSIAYTHDQIFCSFSYIIYKIFLLNIIRINFKIIWYFNFTLDILGIFNTFQFISYLTQFFNIYLFFFHNVLSLAFAFTIWLFNCVIQIDQNTKVVVIFFINIAFNYDGFKRTKESILKNNLYV